MAVRIDVVLDYQRLHLNAIGFVRPVDAAGPSRRWHPVIAGERIGQNQNLSSVRRVMQEAISSPLLEEASIQGARGVLINITGGHDLTLFEVNEAASIVRQEADEDANIIFGHVIDESMADAMKITVIATGFRREAAVASVGSGAQMPVTSPPRYAPRTPDDFPASQPGNKRVDDLDVPTFIRKKAD